MSGGTVIDVAVVLILAAYAWSGYRRGLILTIVAAVGFLAGAGVALWLLPERVAGALGGDLALLRPVALVTLVVFFATLGQMLLVRVVRGVARSLGRTPLGILDAVLGSVLTVAVAATMVWFSAGVLRVVGPAELARSIGQSRVVKGVDRAMPTTSDAVIGQVKAALDQYGFPRVFSTIEAESIRPVDGVDGALPAAAAIRGAVASVLRVDAEAPACGRHQEGTGWVAADGLVVTNAHVVAGSGQVTVRSSGQDLPARVVAFDSGRDVAVLSVGGLGERPLRLGRQLAHGDSAVVAGYPLGGPLKVDAARVRDVLNARGDDIYGKSQVDRQVYSLLATVQPGNSGGPLLAPDGSVAGVVFARSLDDASTGYALTLEELRPVLGRASRGGASVGTGTCAR